MKNDVVNNAVGMLEQLMFKAQDALRDLERDMYGTPARFDPPYEYPLYALEEHLQELHDVMLVVLEAAGMLETRVALVKAWPTFKKKKGGLRYTDDNYQIQTCESPALTFMRHMIQGLRASVSKPVSGEEAWTLSRLEAMLRDSAALMHRRQVAPKNENEVQKVMHDYLSAAFADFRSNPSIGGTLKSFKPDCGVASVGAAIEFKFVRSKEEIAVAASGIFEDTAGYRGSKDWVRFYSVIYQAQAFMLESHLRHDLKRVGAAVWTPIVVNGSSRRSAAKKQASRNSGVSNEQASPPKVVAGSFANLRHLCSALED
ncbi:hypothetical protein JQ594_00695 [Bradyrhizobium manausense]|uniref:hypothetical protein n=1 Tax=Bradyrhizobium manausense TaxID=989370 RepID=UPI001BA6E008|nr:hypothetical protein [Bradyrhizobium manausense]MBR0684420.1 hypothetical protein [Bradyrhizobium manausense]